MMALETLNATLSDSVLGGILAGAGAAAIIGITLIVLLLALGIYIYTSLAYAKIGKKAKQKSPNVAWIPIIGKPLVALRAAKMSWIPLLLILGYLIAPLAAIFSLAFSVFVIIWNWKMMERIKRPGWWALFLLISPVYWVLLGVAAWGKK